MKTTISHILFVLAASLLSLSVLVKADENSGQGGGGGVVDMGTYRVTASKPKEVKATYHYYTVTLSFSSSSNSGGGGAGTGVSNSGGMTTIGPSKSSANCGLLATNMLPSGSITMVGNGGVIYQRAFTEFTNTLGTQVVPGIYIQEMHYHFDVTNSDGSVATGTLSDGSIVSGTLDYTFYESFDAAGHPVGSPVVDTWKIPSWNVGATGSVVISGRVKYFPNNTSTNISGDMKQLNAVLPDTNYCPAGALLCSATAPALLQNDSTPANFAASGSMSIQVTGTNSEKVTIVENSGGGCN